MEAFINFVADKFGIDPERATEIAKQLQAKGEDLPKLMEGGFSMEKLQGLLGDKAHLVASIPGAGGILSGLMDGNAVAEIPSPDEVPDPMQTLGKDPR